MEAALQKQVDDGDIPARLTLVHLQIDMKEDARKAAAEIPIDLTADQSTEHRANGEPTVIERRP